MIEKRKVYIERFRASWVVFYVERRKRQRYSAAQFYAQDHSMQDVKDWVAKQPHLELVDKPG